MEQSGKKHEDARKNGERNTASEVREDYSSFAFTPPLIRATCDRRP